MNFLDIFSKNRIISNYKKIRPVKFVLLLAGGRTDGQTDMTNLIALCIKTINTNCYIYIYTVYIPK